jgi:hypothetical protein
MPGAFLFPSLIPYILLPKLLYLLIALRACRIPTTHVRLAPIHLHVYATYPLDPSADLQFVHDWIGHASLTSTVMHTQLTSRRRSDNREAKFRFPVAA